MKNKKREIVKSGIGFYLGPLGEQLRVTVSAPPVGALRDGGGRPPVSAQKSLVAWALTVFNGAAVRIDG